MTDDQRTEIDKPEVLWQQIVAVLRRAILSGELSPDTHLKEPGLAAHFGVSRIPVREAIAQLVREGLVRSEPRRGAYVVGISEQAIVDIYDCRQILETCALRRAATRVDEGDIGVLLALVEQIEAGVGAGASTTAALEMAFHRLIIELSGSRALAIAWEPLTPLIEMALAIAEPVSAYLATTAAQYREIVDALQQHDHEAAIRAMSRHLPVSERLVRHTIGSVRAHPGIVQGALPSRALGSSS